MTEKHDLLKSLVELVEGIQIHADELLEAAAAGRKFLGFVLQHHAASEVVDVQHRPVVKESKPKQITEGSRKFQTKAKHLRDKILEYVEANQPVASLDEIVRGVNASANRVKYIVTYLKTNGTLVSRKGNVRGYYMLKK